MGKSETIFTVPNILSFFRIILSLLLVFTKPLSTAFFSMYILCGLSDMLDGFIARRAGTVSKLGAKLDSVADMLLAGVLLIMLFPVINPSKGILAWITLIAAVRLIAVAVAVKKYRTFAMLHTIGNKLTGMVLFITPLLLSIIDRSLLIYIVCTVASLSAIEELLIQVTSTKLDLNTKSLFDGSVK